MNTMTEQRENKYAVILLVITLMIQGVLAGGEWWDPAPYLNDSALHLHQVERMNEALKSGEPLLDHWDPTIGLGYAFPRTYACGSHLLTLLLGRTGLGFETSWRLLVFFAWVIWPVSLYTGLRRFGEQPLAAACAASCAPLLHTVFRFGIAPETYLWQGYGLLPNLLAVVLLPQVIGWGQAAFTSTSSKALLLTVFLLFLVFNFHMITAYLATCGLILLAIWASLSQGKWQPLAKLCLMGVLTLLSCYPLLVPYFQDAAYINHTRFEPAHYWDSYPFAEIVQALILGDLFDAGVLIPSISLAMLVGVVITLRSGLSRLPLLGLFFFLLLFFGRTAWNPLVYILPFNENLPFERFVIGVQFFGLLLAGRGMAGIANRLPQWKITPIIILLPLSLHIGKNTHALLWRAPQQKLETRIALQHWQESGILESLRGLDSRGRRILVPRETDKAIGPVRFNHIALMEGLNHVGNLWHSMSLCSDFLYRMNESRSDHLNLFGLEYGLAPTGNWPTHLMVPMLNHKGISLYKVLRSNGLFQFGTIVEDLPGKLDDHYEYLCQWLDSDNPGKGYFPRFVSEDEPKLPLPANVPLGSVFQGPEPLQQGYGFKFRTIVPEPAWLIGKINFHPGFQAHLQDGTPLPIHMVAPAFLAIQVPAGESQITLFYQGDPWPGRLLMGIFLLWTGLGVLTCLIKKKTISIFPSHPDRSPS
jgi:hypothetical protein